MNFLNIINKVITIRKDLMQVILFIINKIIEELSSEISKIDWHLIINTKCNKTAKND